MTAELVGKAWGLKGLDPLVKFMIVTIADCMAPEFNLDAAIECAIEKTGIESALGWQHGIQLVKAGFIVRVERGHDEWQLNIGLDDDQNDYRQSQPSQNSNPSRRTGYIYLLKSPSGYYKIGRTVNPQSRLRTFEVRLPFEVEYEWVIKVDDMFMAERSLHERYAAKRVNGEWFALTQGDVSCIKGLDL